MTGLLISDDLVESVRAGSTLS